MSEIAKSAADAYRQFFVFDYPTLFIPVFGGRASDGFPKRKYFPGADYQPVDFFCGKPDIDCLVKLMSQINARGALNHI